MISANDEKSKIDWYDLLMDKMSIKETRVLNRVKSVEKNRKSGRNSTDSDP